ncbi:MULTISPECIES: hypothetical protein [unclassified Bradyrhizobium]|uniref:hypothetical protein n=1 Tax=unclassified Bradyrhizobium TaxID=2631580 RepID=UPI003397F9C8
MYQMRGDLRAKYGVGDSEDPAEQTHGWMRSLPDLRKDMKSVLGRDANDQEVYLGHHFGARRAARMLKMDPSTPVEAQFTPQEMRANPHFARAGTVGNLNGSVMADIGKRMARFGGDLPPSSEPADLSSFGQPAETAQPLRLGTGQPDQSVSQNEVADLSSFGTPVEQPSLASAQPQEAPDLSSFGTPVA